MHPRPATTILLASLLLAVPSCTTQACTTQASEILTSIPAYPSVRIGMDDLMPLANPAPDADVTITMTPAGETDGELDVISDPQDRRRRARAQRTRREFSAFGMVSFASGDYEFRDDALGKDETSAHMGRLRGAATAHDGVGGGFDLKVIVPSDDFYRGTINVTELNHVDLFLYFLTHASSGDVRLPVRIGPYFSNLAAEFQVTGDDTDYTSVGIRAEIEPEVVLIHDDDVEASLFCRLSAGVHGTSIDDESTREDYASEGHTLGFEGGLRLVFDSISLSASYIFHETTNRESETTRGLAIPRLETEFTGVQVSMGVKF